MKITSYKGIIRTFLLSFFSAVVLSIFYKIAVFDLYLDLEIYTEHTTGIIIYYDTGSGFEREKKSSSQLAAESSGQKLRFMLPGQAVERVRIDFTSPAPEITVTGGELVCLQTGSRTSLDIQRLQSYSNVEPAVTESGNVRLKKTGPHPQAVLQLSEYYPQSRLDLKLLAVVSIMLYPVVSFLGGISIRLFHRFSKRPPHSLDAVPLGGTLHLVLVIASAVIWLAAGFYYYEQNRLSSPVLLENKNPVRVKYEKSLEGQKEMLERPDGLQIAARLYAPEDAKEPYPAFLLLHGNYPQGQFHPLYRVLARELADRGYLVMTIDFAGYGKSSDPFDSNSPYDISLEIETEAALTYLATRPDVRPSEIAVIGHSMGADPALRVGLRNEHVSSISLIGPPRRVQEQYHSPDTLGFFWYWAHKIRLQRYGKESFPAWYDKQRWRSDILKRDMIYMLPYLSGLKHKPILFVDGEHELQTDKKFLSEYVRRCSFPKKHIRLQKADHDCNVTQLGKKVMYDSVTIDQLAGAIDEWHTDSLRTLPAVKEAILNMTGLLFRPLRATDCL